MTKESYNFGVDTESRLYTETSGMTAKRFWLVSLEYDGEQRFIRDNNLIGKKSMSNQEVVKLLNELHEENQSLKEENKFLRNKVATYKSGNALLKKTLDKEWK